MTLRPTPLLPSVLFLLAALALPAAAHGPAAHDHGATPSATEIQAEILALPDLPVRDSAGLEAGFRSRLAAAPSVILTFGYTSCDDLCDYSNAILLGVQDMLAEQGRVDVALATLTIDPARDTPDQLARRAAEIGAGPGWLWLTAGEDGTRPLLEALRVPAGPLETHDILFLVGHPCTGRFVRVLGLAEPAALLAALGAPGAECAA